tara:strand:- start:1250 stop:1861 length:612 start_codon:yes stop_codon:yes gene_type:complete
MSEFDKYQDKSLLDGPDPEHDPAAFRQDAGGLITEDNGIAARLLQNDKLYNAMKGDWQREGWNGNHNIKTTTGREDGKFYIRREQMNVDYIVELCAEYRKRAEAGYMDPLAPIMPDGKLGYKWMEIPDVVAVEISNNYFGGMSWHTIKLDRTLKAQFYRVVEQEYPAFICYPGGKLPIPIEVPYPARVGADKFFKGANFATTH